MTAPRPIPSVHPAAKIAVWCTVAAFGAAGAAFAIGVLLGLAGVAVCVLVGLVQFGFGLVAAVL